MKEKNGLEKNGRRESVEEIECEEEVLHLLRWLKQTEKGYNRHREKSDSRKQINNMHRTKLIACRSYMVATSSSSSEDDMLLGTDQEETPALTRDAASSSAVSQHRDGYVSWMLAEPNGAVCRDECVE
ncbi:hypothetical protein NC653_040639 [Populus alba x Populus x berolinensis]|uniref:Uncharacterized protein n=1 Tax=Populus alba x Populus x berolinensis TaxID=444605 RepID=A0AAD6L7N1_9ROSI|nr:hypothetical protein NC653_040639 [Populus alba x Populus x berolinensis]